MSLLIYGAITMAVEWKQIAACGQEDPLYLHLPDFYVYLYSDLCRCPCQKGRMETICHGNTAGELIPNKGQAIDFPQHMAERTDYDPKKRVYSPFCHILLPRLILVCPQSGYPGSCGGFFF